MGAEETHLPRAQSPPSQPPAQEERGPQSVRRESEQLPPPFSASCSLSTSMASRSPSQPPPPSAGLRDRNAFSYPLTPSPSLAHTPASQRPWGGGTEGSRGRGGGKRARERDQENDHLPEPLLPALQHGAWHVTTRKLTTAVSAPA